MPILHHAQIGIAAMKPRRASSPKPATRMTANAIPWVAMASFRAALLVDPERDKIAIPPREVKRKRTPIRCRTL